MACVLVRMKEEEKEEEDPCEKFPQVKKLQRPMRIPCLCVYERERERDKISGF